ncbi:MAG: hypothetical protein U1E60_10865 [Reyranellaceae bacterium]
MFRLICWSLGLLLATINMGEAKSDTRRVIVVPGVMGSKLCDQPERVIWGDRSSYVAGRVNALRLPPDVEQRNKAIENCGLIESINLIPLLWESNVYNSLLSFLKDLGYKPENITIFDYDWRLSNFKNADRLKSTIDRVAPNGKVDIVAHSMGGIIARIYYQSLGGNAKVQNLIMLGTPHLGSAKIFERLKDGFEHWPNSLSGGISEIQKTILSFPSTYQLLPTYAECCAFSTGGDESTAEYKDVLDIETWTRFSWLPVDFKTGPYAKALSAHLEEARKLRELFLHPISTNLDEWTRIFYIANGFVDTWSRVFFDSATGNVVGKTLKPGDGTVLLFSATGGVPDRMKVALRPHETIFTAPEAQLLMTATLSNRRWTSDVVSFDQKIIDKHGVKYAVHSGALDVMPRVISPGQALDLVLTLEGDDLLSKADLSNLRIELFSGETALSSFSMEVGPETGKMRSLRKRIQVPVEPGPYGIRLMNLESLEAYFAVIAP